MEDNLLDIQEILFLALKSLKCKIEDRFHENFVASLKACPLLYIGVNLDVRLEN